MMDHLSEDEWGAWFVNEAKRLQRAGLLLWEIAAELEVDLEMVKDVLYYSTVDDK